MLDQNNYQHYCIHRQLILLKQPVYMYKVKGKGFHQHPRLPEMKYIIETSMPVQGAKRIPNAYQELKRIGTTFIPYR